MNEGSYVCATRKNRVARSMVRIVSYDMHFFLAQNSLIFSFKNPI